MSDDSKTCVQLAFLVTSITALPSEDGSTPTVRRCTRPLYRNELRPFRLLGSWTVHTNTATYLTGKPRWMNHKHIRQVILAPKLPHVVFTDWTTLLSYSCLREFIADQITAQLGVWRPLCNRWNQVNSSIIMHLKLQHTIQQCNTFSFVNWSTFSVY